MYRPKESSLSTGEMDLEKTCAGLYFNNKYSVIEKIEEDPENGLEEEVRYLNLEYALIRLAAGKEGLNQTEQSYKIYEFLEHHEPVINCLKN